MIRKIKHKISSLLYTFCHVLSISFWVFILFSFEEVSLAITTLICALIHEMGHIIYIFLISDDGFSFRGAVNGFRIRPRKLRSYKQEILVYLSGPFANIFAFVICVLFSFAFGKAYIEVGLINLVTALSNLMPIKGYDGYGAIRAFIKNHGFCDRALQLISCVSSVLTFSFCVFSLYLIDRYSGGYWIFAVFFTSMIKELKEGLGE